MWKTVAIVLAILFAFVGGGIATWWGITANLGASTGSEPVVEHTQGEPKTEQPGPPSAEDTEVVEVPTAGLYTVERAIAWAEASALSCQREEHPLLSSYWCVGDSGQLRVYLGGDRDGTLQHISLTNVGQWSTSHHDELMRGLGEHLMPADSYDLQLIKSHFEGEAEETPEMPMGGRSVRVRAWAAVIITTPGWAVGIDQPRLRPYTADNVETLTGYGFECYEDGTWFNCSGYGDGAYYGAGGSNDGELWASANPDGERLPQRAGIELQSLAWALTGHNDDLYVSIFNLEPGEFRVVDGLLMSHLKFEAGAGEMEEFTIEVGCWAAARTDC